MVWYNKVLQLGFQSNAAQRIMLSIDRLPIVVLAHILAFGPQDLARLHAVARALLGRSALDRGVGPSERIFQALCKTTWPSVSDKTFDVCRGGENGSWRALYRVLQTWTPREGFYSLLEVNPWGMILRMRFMDGAFVGELLCPLEEQQIHTLRQVSGVEAAFRYDAVLRIEFGDDGSVERVRIVGAADVGEGEGAGGNNKKPKPDDIKISFGGDVKGVRYPTEFGSQFPNVVASAGAIRIHDTIPDAPPSDSRVTRVGRRLSAALSALVSSGSSTSDTAESATPTVDLERALGDPASPHTHADIFRELWRRGRMRGNAQLTLDWIDGPTRMSSFTYHDGMPILRPGLYSGVYHEMYGKFRREVVLIEYRQYALPLDKAARDAAWKRIGHEIYNQADNRTDGQSDATGVFDAVKDAVNATFHDREDSVIFVIGRKVTGDVHVPMRQLTFGAVVHPPISLLAADGGTAPSISEVRDRGEGQSKHRVIRSWSGWGTLAYPRFSSPSWARGMLVQVDEPDPAQRAITGRHVGAGGRNELSADSVGAGPEDLFGFVWSRDGDFSSVDDTSIFRRLRSQDEFPWFSDTVGDPQP